MFTGLKHSFFFQCDMKTKHTKKAKKYIGEKYFFVNIFFKIYFITYIFWIFFKYLNI